MGVGCIINGGCIDIGGIDWLVLGISNGDRGSIVIGDCWGVTWSLLPLWEMFSGDDKNICLIERDSGLNDILLFNVYKQ